MNGKHETKVPEKNQNSRKPKNKRTLYRLTDCAIIIIEIIILKQMNLARRSVAVAVTAAACSEMNEMKMEVKLEREN